MFSASNASGPGDQRSFKPHTPHLFPWLRNGLKPHHRSDLGLNGPYKHPTEPHNDSAPRKRAKGLGFLSKELMGNIQGKDREVKGELRCNGVGLAKRLPVVLREHHMLPENQGRQREDSPARWSQSPELDPDPESQGLSHSTTSVHDNYSEYSFVRNHNSHLNLLHSQTDGAHPSVKKYVPLLTPAPVPAPALPGKFKGQEPNYKVPVVVCTDEGREKLWRYARHTYHQSNLHSSSWLNSDSQGLTDGQQGFSSGVRYTKELGKNFQSQRDLTRLREPTGEALNGPNSLPGIIFSTEVPTRHMSSTTILRGPRKPRPISEHGLSLGQNQRWIQSRPTSGGDQLGSRKDAGQLRPRCSRKAVRDQIKRVVDNLEQVLGGLKDVHQEMKEVVEQIEYLTSSIDLNEGEKEEEEEEGEGGGGDGGGGDDGAKPPGDSSSSSSSSGVTVGSNHQNPDQEDKQRSAHRFSTIRKRRPINRIRSQSPQGVLPQTQNTASSSEVRPLHLTHNPGSSSKRFGPPSYPSSSVKSDSPPQPQDLTSKNFSSPPHRSSPLPVRPPTPGLSPLTVNLHPPSNTPGPSPGPQLRSPGPSSPIRVGPVSPLSPLSSKPPPPPALSPSVIIETKALSYRTPHSDHPSAIPLSPSSAHPPSRSSAPKEPGTQPKIDGGGDASSVGPLQLPQQEHATPATMTRAPLTQGHRGRKPPPYPHNRHFERKAKEPRKAPPYPEKRRLLSTTV